MLILAVKPGHDGAIAAIKDRQLLFSLESEKDSFGRYALLNPMTILAAVERLGELPDVVAIGGWYKAAVSPNEVGAGYSGVFAVEERPGRIFGHDVQVFSSSHTRSHIWMGAGMAPPDEATARAVLVWEGIEGAFYLLDERWNIVREIPVLDRPGDRYAMVFGIADPKFPDEARYVRLGDSGKLMALAAFARPEDAPPEAVAVVDRLLDPNLGRPPKGNFADTALHNAGVESDITKFAAALITKRIFDLYADVARAELPEGIPLYISGGCGLNCDWNSMWRELGHFSSVFVPPCANDSGSALGTALDALHAATGDPRIEWDVYCGLDFDTDMEPDVGRWERQSLDDRAVAEALGGGDVIAWVQGRWEMGPRALGNRSLLAEPFTAATRDRLNKIKLREDYRPIAPVCRLEDAGAVFDRDFPDPFMLYFRRVTVDTLGAVTHVDGSARAQTVTAESNARLHSLLSAFAERHGVGLLCNTSLNFRGLGFINRMSDLVAYAEGTGLEGMVVGDTWFRRRAWLTRSRLSRSASIQAPGPG